MITYLFVVGYGLGLILAFARHPIYGLYTYLFTFYMSPNDIWWGKSLPDIRYLMIAGIVAVAATLARLPADPHRRKWFQTTPGRLLILFVIYNWLQIFWAVDTDRQQAAAILFSKHLVAFYLMYRLADSLDRIKEIAIVHVIGCAWFGYQALGVGGGRLERIGGAVAGANELGVHVSTGLIFGGVLLLALRGVRRWAVFASLPLVANTLVLTVSRGAFLGFLTGGLAGYLAMPKRLRKRYAMLGALGLLLVSMLAHQELIERFKATYVALTTEEQELDNSATSRIEIAKAGIIIGLRHPFGAGDKSTELLSGPYISGWDHGRAAHNTLAGVFAEHGFPGLTLYLLTILWVVRTALRMRRLPAQGQSELADIAAIAGMAAASLVAIYVSGNFSSNIDLETQYWCLALLAATTELTKSVRQQSVLSPMASKPGPLAKRPPLPARGATT